jgi:hypothetical protein
MAILMIPAARLARAGHPGGHDGLIAVPAPESSRRLKRRPSTRTLARITASAAQPARRIGHRIETPPYGSVAPYELITPQIGLVGNMQAIHRPGWHNHPAAPAAVSGLG